MRLDKEVPLGPGHIVLHGDPAPPKRAQLSPLHFQPMSIVAKRLDGSKCHLLWR